LPPPLLVKSPLIQDYPESNKLKAEAPGNDPSTDVWSEWLLRHRHGSDPNHEQVIRGMVEQIRDRVLDGASLSAGMVLVDVGAGDGLITFGAFEPPLTTCTFWNLMLVNCGMSLPVRLE